MEISKEIMDQIPPETLEDKEIAEMIRLGKLEELNHCFRNFIIVKYLFGARTKSAEAIKRYDKGGIICHVKTATQEAEVLLRYALVLGCRHEYDFFVFTTELV